MRIYLDHNAGSPLRTAVRDALVAALERGPHANPASVHRAGQEARRELERARARVARLIGATPRDVIFTSGGTESNNLAINAAFGSPPGRRRLISTVIEHSSLLEPLALLERCGYEIVRILPDHDGLIDQEEVIAAIDRSTTLVMVGLVNAEIGAIQKVDAIAEVAHQAGALFHLDAAQAAGRIPLRVDDLGCDLLTISAHKLGGPAGIGALYVRSGVILEPQLRGGPQETFRRAGTPNLLGAIGFGVAAEEVTRSREDENRRLDTLARRLLVSLKNSIPGLVLNGPAESRVPNTLNLTFPGVLGESMLMALDLAGVEVSMGSACAAGAVEPSHVLTAMGRGADVARSSLRLSLGWSTTEEEITVAGELIPAVWRRVVAAEPAGRITNAGFEASR